MDCRVVLEAAVSVDDVSTADEAIRIAISKTGKQLNPELSHVAIATGERTSPSGEPLEPVFVVADEALVALELEMTVVAVERDEHAERVARKEIGQRLENVPLSVTTVEDVTGQTDESDEEGGPSGDAVAGPDREAVPDPTGEADPSTATAEDADRRVDANGGRRSAEQTDDDVLPEFEELL